MQLWKAHGLGNDYLVWEQERIKLTDFAVRKICHRHIGIGGDGILEPTPTHRAEYGVRIWNPDGSVAEKSGNGLRIFALWLFLHRNAGSSFRVDTGTDIVECFVNADRDAITIEMGKAQFSAPDIPTTVQLWDTPFQIGGHTIPVWSVGMGNPHCVSFFPDAELDALPWRKWGAYIETHEFFPNRTNVQFATVLDPHNIDIRIWERGAGETAASGSSSCAVAAIACRMGWVRSPITIHMPGGSLHISITKDFSVTLTGPVSEIGRCRIAKQFIDDLAL